MDTLKLFLKERALKLNVGKTKIMVFNKQEKERKKLWSWKGKRIEKVCYFKYLGLTFNRKGNNTDHIKEMSIKSRLAE